MAIYEKKLIEEFRKSHILFNGTPMEESDMMISYRSVVRVINKQPKVGEWIPCSERLPENMQVVIFSTKEGMVESGWFDAEKKWCINDSYFPNAFKIIAWMPLPEAFNAERGGKYE